MAEKESEKFAGVENLNQILGSTRQCYEAFSSACNGESTYIFEE